MLLASHHGGRGMTKFGFKIRTRSGLVVDNLLIPGKDQADAQRKLNQIYRHCEILESKSVQQAARDESMDMDGIISLISRQGTIQLGIDRLHRDIRFLPIAQDLDLERPATAVPRELLKFRYGMNGLPVDSYQLVAFFQAGLVGGIPGFHGGELNFTPPIPTGGATGAIVGRRSDHGVEPFALALNRQVHRPVSAGHGFQANIFPSRVALAIQFHDAVAILNPGFGGRRIRRHMTDDGLHILVGDLLVLDHEQSGEQANREHHVHEGAGEGDNSPLPAGLGQEAARIGDILIARLLACHLDVAAQQEQREFILRLTAPKAEQTRPETETEGLYFYIEVAGCPKMSQLVDQNHDPDQDQPPKNVFKNLHISLSRDRASIGTRCYQLARQSAGPFVDFENLAYRPGPPDGDSGQGLVHYFEYRQKADFSL